MSSDGQPWYHAGLRFECTGCGDCCTGAEGYVWVRRGEIAVLADGLGMTVEDFEARYVRRVEARKSLIELPGGDCVFFDPDLRRCKVYQFRPHQCRTWPFWESNLESRRTWGETRAACPGCGKGPLYTLEEIEPRKRVVRV